MSGQTFTVLIVEDHLMVAAGLAAMLEDEPDLEVVGQAATVAAATDAVARLRPDVVMLDFRLPDGEGAPAIAAVLEANPDVKVLTVTAHSEAEALGPAVSAGVMGFVRKDAPGDELLQAVRTVAAGGAYFSREAMAQIIAGQRPQPAGPAVSEREVQVLQCLADGLADPRDRPRARPQPAHRAQPPAGGHGQARRPHVARRRRARRAGRAGRPAPARLSAERTVRNTGGTA